MSEITASSTYYLNKIFNAPDIVAIIDGFKDEVEKEPLCDYLNKLLTEKGMKKLDVIKNSGIETHSAYRYFSGTRTPLRDSVIQLAFGFGLKYDEAQKLLKAAGQKELNSKIKRDAVIIHALYKGYDIDSVQITLYELGMIILGG